VAPGLSNQALGRCPPGVAGHRELIGCFLRLVPGLADLSLVGGRRAACLPVGSSLAWAWATAVIPARFTATSVTATMPARVRLDMVVLRSVNWRCVGGRLAGRRPRLATGSTATSDEPAATGVGAVGERHPSAAHGWPGRAVR
jgi:hypothetical protein